MLPQAGRNQVNFKNWHASSSQQVKVANPLVYRLCCAGFELCSPLQCSIHDPPPQSMGIAAVGSHFPNWASSPTTLNCCPKWHCRCSSNFTFTVGPESAAQKHFNLDTEARSRPQIWHICLKSNWMVDSEIGVLGKVDYSSFSNFQENGPAWI